MKALDFLVTFIGGAVVGAACGLLFAPEKGSDLRGHIRSLPRVRPPRQGLHSPLCYVRSSFECGLEVSCLLPHPVGLAAP